MKSESDFELAITKLDDTHREWLAKSLPEGYFIESRVDTGYGLVIRSVSSEAAADLNEKFDSFFRPLLTLANMIKDRDCMLRVAIFSSSACTTTTWPPSMQEALLQLSCALELAIYPTSEDSE